ncbi:MAG: hypothetical protein ACJA19_001798 [Bacteroidia bacterium]|jgi:hypothetical protein|tara:strand:+ start:256 stop:630 length:375 start_codon:yes stop_codon:yes gene_type:complete
MKKLFIVLLLFLPILFSSCDILFDVISYSLEQNANKPDVNYNWELVYGGVSVSGTIGNSSPVKVKSTEIEVSMTAVSGETDYEWVKISTAIPSNGCVRFCETVYTNLDDVSDVLVKVHTYDVAD